MAETLFHPGMAARPASLKQSTPRPFLIFSSAALSWLLVGDWLAPLAVLLLWAIWLFLPTEEGPPVLALALTFQWAQVNAGVFYHGLTGRDLEATAFSDYRPMVLMGMGCVAALLAGLKLAFLKRWRP